MAFLGAGQDAEADQDAEPTQLFGLPEEVLMHIISFVESPADVRSALLTCRGALARAADTYLQVKWKLQRCEHAMELAARNGTPAIVLRPPEVGTFPIPMVWDFRDKREVTLLELATVYNYPDIVDVLLSRDDVRTDKAAVQLAFRIAIESNRWECVQALLAPHSPVSANSMFSEECLLASPLIHAAKFASVDVVKILLSQGAECALCNSLGRTALHEACASSYNAASRGKIVRRVLRTDASILDKQDFLGQTPLSLAALNNLSGCCKALLLAGSSLSIEPQFGGSPLSLLVSGSGLYTQRVCKVLQKYGVLGGH